jgi:AcrR family transcriptional regulator
MGAEAIDEPLDPLREQLLEAAARVFAAKGYSGTRIMDIVKEAKLSSGAVYGRFASKDELLMEAVLGEIRRNAVVRKLEGRSVGDALVDAIEAGGPLDDAEAVHLEAFVAARREPDVAAALAASREHWRETMVGPLIDRAVADGSASPQADFDSAVYFIEALHLGLLVQRGAGQPPPDPDAWHRFMARIFGALAAPKRDA